jgi:hypothetical protein
LLISSEIHRFSQTKSVANHYSADYLMNFLSLAYSFFLMNFFSLRNSFFLMNFFSLRNSFFLMNFSSLRTSS